MNSLVVDDKQLAVNAVVRIVITLDPEGTCEGVRTADAALEYVRTHAVDVAFLDVEMPQMTALNWRNASRICARTSTSSS